jgi:hypothetical protein
MLLVGENLNVMVKRIGTAMKDRDPKPIQELAIAEAKAGVDFIDINLGPARKGGGELMEWIVTIVQEVVDTPLYLDTINAEAIGRVSRYTRTRKGSPSSIRSWPGPRAWMSSSRWLRSTMQASWLSCGDPPGFRGMQRRGECWLPS